MSDHKVLLAIPNPFIKHDKRYASKPCLVWLTRQRGVDDGRGILGTHYLLLLYRFDGRVKHHYEFTAFDRKPRHESSRPSKEEGRSVNVG